MEERRKVLELKLIRKGKQRSVRDNVEKKLAISGKWWGDDEWETWSSDESEDEDEDEDEDLYVSPYFTSNDEVVLGSLTRAQDPSTGLYHHARVRSADSGQHLPVVDHRLSTIPPQFRARKRAVHARPLRMSEL